MRPSLRASHTALGSARWLGVGTLAAGAALAIAASVAGVGSVAGCAYATKRPAPPRQPPPPVLVVGLEQVALRTTAWVELHAWLASAARAADADAEKGEAAFDGAVRAYAAVLADDDRDELLGRTMRALEACEDERCARAAVLGSPFATPYLDALPSFLARSWPDRATAARGAIERARAAIGPELEPLVTTLARDLAIAWPASPPLVDVVVDAPEPGRGAPVRVVLGARGGCFAKARGDTDRMHDARIVDCVLGYAALRLDSRSELAIALGRELGTRGKTRELGRAWTAVVVHAVATTVSGWEPRHSSALRRSAAATMPETMAWLAREWPARMRGETAPSFAKRYIDALLEPGSGAREGDEGAREGAR